MCELLFLPQHDPFHHVFEPDLKSPIIPISCGKEIGIAVWRVGHPNTDIDGDARPAEDGAPDIAGADVR